MVDYMSNGLECGDYMSNGLEWVDYMNGLECGGLYE